MIAMVRFCAKPIAYDCYLSGSKDWCRNSYLKISQLKSLVSGPGDFVRQNMQKDFKSISDLFKETFKTSDKSVNGNVNTFCGKFEQFHKSELQLMYEDESEPGAYLIEYLRHSRKKSRKLGFQLDFR